MLHPRTYPDPYIVDFHDLEDVKSFVDFQRHDVCVIRAETGYRIVATNKLNWMQRASALYRKAR